MQLQLRLEILSQHHAHIHPAQRIRRQHHATDAEPCPHCSAARWVAATDENLGGVDHPIGISPEHHIQAYAPEHAGSHASGARPTCSVQDLDHDAVIGGRHGVGVTDYRFRPGRLEQHRTPAGTQQDAGRDQCEAEGVTARLFQNRKVGSGMGHPERTR